LFGLHVYTTTIRYNVNTNLYTVTVRYSVNKMAVNTFQCIQKTTTYISTDINAPPFKEVLSTFYQLNWCITNKCNQNLVIILFDVCVICEIVTLPEDEPNDGSKPVGV
jgi:hypothetical protein